MNTTIKFIALLLILNSCNTTPRERALRNVEDYNDKLEQLIAKTLRPKDTASINFEFNNSRLSTIPDSILTSISNEDVFKELLRTENELLSSFQPIPNFKSYAGIVIDTPLKLIRGCATFDRAPSNERRSFSFQGARLLSFEYYKYVVPVSFHVIMNRNGDGWQGDMQRRINDQINLMNNIYAPFNIRFTLHSIDSVRNDTWFNRGSYYIDSNVLKQMTSRLSVEPKLVMNVFTLGSEVLGEATFPWSSDKQTFMDYIVINYNTLPGGPNDFYNGMYKEGKTLVHEAGHFLGLLHTFEGGQVNCRSALNDGCNIGDEVSDTPWQRICYFEGCDGNADSCPTDGKDPINNFLGYNPDACMTMLTVGQGDRIKACIYAFRRYLIVNPVE